MIGYDGINCNIRLEIVHNNIYLAGGWEYFFDHHNLKGGYIVVFEYNGNSTFDVLIFYYSSLKVTYDFNISEAETTRTNNPVFEVTLIANHDAHQKIVRFYLTSIVCHIYPPLLRCMKHHFMFTFST